MKTSEFQIGKTQLLSFNYAINENFSGEDMSIEIQGDVNVMNSKDDDNIAKVILSLNIFNEKDFDKVPFYIKSSMSGEFYWSEDIDEELLQSLLKTNAPAILLSYLRPFISQVTSFSGFQPLILPLLNFTD